MWGGTSTCSDISTQPDPSEHIITQKEVCVSRVSKMIWKKVTLFISDWILSLNNDSLLKKGLSGNVPCGRCAEPWDLFSDCVLQHRGPVNPPHSCFKLQSFSNLRHGSTRFNQRGYLGWSICMTCINIITITTATLEFLILLVTSVNQNGTMKDPTKYVNFKRLQSHLIAECVGDYAP